MKRSESHAYWSDSRRQLRRRLRRKLRFAEADRLEDLTQEALVRFVRYSRTQEVRCRDALLTRIADRVAVDEIRRQSRCPVVGESEDRPLSELAAPPRADEAPCDPLERVRFLILSYLERHDPEGRQLARAYFEGLSWSEYAEQTGTRADVVRKRWSRCVERMRRDIAERPASVTP